MNAKHRTRGLWMVCVLCVASDSLSILSVRLYGMLRVKAICLCFALNAGMVFSGKKRPLTLMLVIPIFPGN